MPGFETMCRYPNLRADAIIALRLPLRSVVYQGRATSVALLVGLLCGFDTRSTNGCPDCLGDFSASYAGTERCSRACPSPCDVSSRGWVRRRAGQFRSCWMLGILPGCESESGIGSCLCCDRVLSHQYVAADQCGVRRELCECWPNDLARGSKAAAKLGFWHSSNTAHLAVIVLARMLFYSV